MIWRLYTMKDLLPQGHIWQSVIQNAPYIIMIVDCQGTILYINHTVAGLKASKVPGKKLWDYIEPDYHRASKKALHTVFDKGKSTSYTIKGTGPHGSSSWYESVLSPITDQGKIIAASIITHDITKQKQAEDALSESERKFRVITERSVDGIFSLDQEGNYTFVSPAVKRIAGYEPEEVNGHFFLDFIYPDDIPLAMSSFDNLMDKGLLEGLELRIKKKDGSLGYVEITASSIIKEGTIHGIQGIVRDISARKKTDESIHRQNELTNAILHAVTESIYVFDKQMRILSVNITGAQRVGKNPQDLIGTAGKLWFSDDLVKRRQSIMEKVFQNGEQETFQDQVGSRWFIANIYPIKDKEGKVDKIVVFSQDITQEKNQEILLEKNEQKYRTIFEHSPEGIVLLDTQGNIIDANGRLSDWLGYRRKEVIGKHISDQPFFSPETKDLLINKFHQRMQKKNIPPYEIEIIAQNGHRIIGMLQGTLLYDQNGDIIGDLVMISDITQRRSLEKKVFEQEKLAALGRIAAMVSHELNTPLTNISLAIELLSSQVPHQVPQQLSREITTIKSEVSHAADIISRILDFSRGNTLRYSPVDIGQIVENAIKTVTQQNGTTDVTFNIPTPRSLTVEGDKYKLLEAFLNLFKNALEAKDPHKTHHTISVKTISTDNHVTVIIQDTGVGIDKDKLETTTDAFYTTKPLGEGTGLGLTITQEIITAHGGELAITSQLHKGTTVTVTLPKKNNAQNNTSVFP